MGAGPAVGGAGEARDLVIEAMGALLLERRPQHGEVARRVVHVAAREAVLVLEVSERAMEASAQRAGFVRERGRLHALEGARVLDEGERAPDAAVVIEVGEVPRRHGTARRIVGSAPGNDNDTFDLLDLRAATMTRAATPPRIKPASRGKERPQPNRGLIRSRS